MTAVLKKTQIFLIFIGLTFLSFLLSNYNQQTHPDKFFFGSKEKIIENNKKARAAEITNIVKSTLDKKPGRYATYVKDLKTGQEFELKSNETFGTASVYKLAVMYKTYDEINQGTLKKDDILSAEKERLDQILSGQQNSSKEKPLQNLPDELVSLDVESALESMITISDNYSALLLANRLGWKDIDQFLKEQDILEFDLVGENSPQATARSVGLLLEKIYANSAVNTKYSQEMKSLLFAQKINDRIPKYLPPDIKIGHKTGELESLRHDAGIVLGRNSHYIFVFLSETPEPETAAENIATLSKNLFEALEGNYTDPD